jgi:hypothetical protein
MTNEVKYPEGWEANFKRFVEEWAEVSHNKAVAHSDLQDKLNDQYLKHMANLEALTLRTADMNAASLNRAVSGAASVDVLAGFGGLTNPAELAETAIGAKVAEKVDSAVSEAMETALGATALTSPPAQGTTGVVQGTVQAAAAVEMAQVLENNITIQTQLLARLAQISDALAVILVNVTGEAVTVKK